MHYCSQCIYWPLLPCLWTVLRIVLCRRSPSSLWGGHSSADWSRHWTNLYKNLDPLRGSHTSSLLTLMAEVCRGLIRSSCSSLVNNPCWFKYGSKGSTFNCLNNSTWYFWRIFSWSDGCSKPMNQKFERFHVLHNHIQDSVDTLALQADIFQKQCLL